MEKREAATQPDSGPWVECRFTARRIHYPLIYDSIVLVCDSSKLE